MKPFNVFAHIHSLNGDMQEVTVIGQEEMFGHPIPNAYIVKYGGVTCTAIFNPLTGEYYADDKFAIVKEN